MYKEDSVLYNLNWLVCHKTKKNTKNKKTTNENKLEFV